jgi:hypothetical protein
MSNGYAPASHPAGAYVLGDEQGGEVMRLPFQKNAGRTKTIASAGLLCYNGGMIAAPQGKAQPAVRSSLRSAFCADSHYGSS